MLRLSLATLVALVASGCATTPASELANPPAFNPEGQTQCKVKKSAEKPLIVEWPSADRAELEATAKGGTVVVAYNGCEMRVLSRCRAPGEYGYTPVTPKADTITIKNDDELYANIPIYAAKFEAKLAQSGQLNVAMTMVGRYTTDQSEVKIEQLTGACDGATHIISGLTVGAFEFFAGAAAELGAGVEVVGVGAGAKSAAKKETLTQDGSTDSCAGATTADAQPPNGCGALLRVEVAALAGSSESLLAGPEGDVSGEWTTEYENDGGLVATELRFVQIGNALYGAYGGDGYYEGTLTGREFSGTWVNQGRGVVRFTFTQDGSRFEGVWGFFGEAEPTKAQRGTRVAKFPAAAPALDVSGRWDGGYDAAQGHVDARTDCTTAGSRVSCVYGEKGRNFGVLAGMNAYGIWINGDGGRYEWTFGQDGRTFVGKWGPGAAAMTFREAGKRQ